MAKKDQKKEIAKHFGAILDILGLDRHNDPNLIDTPRRIADMYYDELCKALHEPPPDCTTFPTEGVGENEMVIVRSIEFTSLCSHHWLPFTGHAHIAYIPGKTFLGLSKFNRVVNYFAAQPQLQERLTDQIGKFLITTLETSDVAVLMLAKHHCMSIRGVKDHSSDTVTSFVSGKFKEMGVVRDEFFKLLTIPL